MKKILITKPILSDYKSLLNCFNVKIWDEDSDGILDYQRLKEIIPEYDGIISMLSNKLDRELLSQAKNLKIIAQYAVGVNNIDLEYCRDNNITICHTPDVLTKATAETAFCLLTNIARNIQPAAANARSGQWKDWEPLGFLGKSMFELKLGIIGAGRIGQEFATLCKNAFNMEIFYYSRTDKVQFEYQVGAKKLSLDELLKTVDVVSLHCPLTDETKNLLNDRTFSLLRDDVMIINTARGEVIDQKALLKFLKNNSRAKAGLDVTTPEPLSPQHELFNVKNCLILPHIGSATYEARSEMSQIVCNSLLKFFNNEELKYILDT